MADEIPEQIRPEEDAKKDTVRINLPPGLTGRSSSPIGAPAGKPGPPGVPIDESKRTTAIMGRSAETPKPKQDTSRVQVAAAKPGTPETPRPSVKLRQDEAVPAPAPAPATAKTTTTPAARTAPAAAAAPSGAETGLSLLAIVLSIAVAAYLAMLAFG
jgi:hypothetical protein